MLHSLHIAVAAYVAYYLAAHALLTKSLWSRYPRWLDSFMTCAACSGAWWMLGMALVARFARGWLFLGLDVSRPWGAMLVLGFGCFLVPLLGAAHLGALRVTHVALPEPTTTQGPVAD